MAMKSSKFILLGVLVLSLFARSAEKESKRISFPGRSPSPAIDRSGNTAFLFLDDRGRLSFGRQGTPSGGFSIWKEESSGRETSSPRLKEDRIGRLWAVWTKTDTSTSEILLGRPEATGLREHRSAISLPGIIFSLDLDFDLSNTAWIAWIVRTGKTFKVCVRDATRGRTWIVGRPPLPSASQVRILAGGPSGPWIFWTGQSLGRDEIFASRFREGRWSEPARLNANDSVPHLFLNAALDPAGKPWVVWSAYDGDDYEIYSTFWNGFAWAGEEKVTDNRACDAYPSLAFGAGPNPVMIWSRIQGAKNSICALGREARIPGRERELVILDGGGAVDPRIALRNGRLAVFWESGGAVHLKNFFWTDLAAKKPAVSSWEASAGAPGDALDENVYIGFGDSITAGEINHDPAPELGYIPRLENILDTTFGPSTVINEGFPGEKTFSGVVRIDEVLPRHSARFLLLMEGTNDVIHLEISPDTTAFNIREMVRKCRDFGTFPILSSIIPRSDVFWDRAVFRDRIYEINEKISDIQTTENVSFVDMFNVFYNYSEQLGGWRSLLSDGVHPNEKGYQIMAYAWWSEIKDIPFAPSGVSAVRATERSLFFSREVNVLTWRHNLKISNPFLFRTYKIFRKDLDEDPDKYHPLITILFSQFSNPQKYADFNIKTDHHYQYAVSLSRDDLVEGPLSTPADDSP